ncbi:MAG: hypothetical protein NTX03_12755 [Bacteroidetes bacterium]|nr:hypothetical protein [Bacteroidota bacterium]
MKKFYLIILCLMIAIINAYPNAAQPGVFNAGGTKNFSPLFPEDSINSKKIQMKTEFVSVDLYKGYAVVKGVYRMFNVSGHEVKIKTGYPINDNLHAGGSHGTDIHFDSLYKIKVLVNGQPVKLTVSSEKSQRKYGDKGNWYVWETTYPPDSFVKIEVYFIMNTNESYTRQGYNSEKKNGFVYILESGSSWARDIDEGDIVMHLNDGLRIEDIYGISPSSIFQVNEKMGLLWYNFRDLKPTDKNNIIVTYFKNQKEFIFPDVVKKSDELFTKIDGLEKIFKDNNEGFAAFTFASPFELGVYWEFYEILAGIALIIIGLPAVVIILVRRRLKKRKKNNSHINL